MSAPLSNRQRIDVALSCSQAPDCLPFLPWGLDVMANPPHPSYRPLWDLLSEQAIVKRRWVQDQPDFFSPSPEIERRETRRAAPDGTIITRVVLRGPGGELESETCEIPGTSAVEVTSRPLKSADDARLYLTWPFVQPPAIIAPFFVCEQSVGERGVVTRRISDAMGMVGANFEPEPLALCSVEEPEVVHQLLAVFAARIYRHTQSLLEAGARPIFLSGGPEFATPPLLSPRQFDAFVARVDLPLHALVHAHGCKIIVHCHGRLTAVLERFLELDIDALHPIEAPPMGDITLAEAKRRVGNRLCLVGNLQIGDMMTLPPDDIYRQVMHIREVAPTGMIVTTSATPYETILSPRLLENYAAALRATRA